LNISEISTDKIIYVNAYVIDRFGNIYLSGVKSNNVEHIKMIVNAEEKNGVRVKDVMFFVYKFELN